MRNGVAVQAPLCVDPGAQVNTHTLSLLNVTHAYSSKKQQRRRWPRSTCRGAERGSVEREASSEFFFKKFKKGDERVARLFLGKSLFHCVLSLSLSFAGPQNGSLSLNFNFLFGHCIDLLRKGWEDDVEGIPNCFSSVRWVFLSGEFKWKLICSLERKKKSKTYFLLKW